MPLTIGERIGPYEIVALLGVGGMGEVYRARDTKLGRQVALKVLSPALAGNAEYMARFQREAKVLASLNHPNIAALYGIEENALVMELVEGQTLSGPLPVETAIAYGKQMCDGLDYAHEKGVVHRDLKPANVKVTPEGVVKLLDFGLAKVAEETVTSGNPDTSPTLTMAATRMGAIMGTAAYMAPEQARGQVVDKRADIWSFGVVLYEIVTGQRLFHGETVGDTLAEVLKKEIDLSGTPAEVRPVIRQCLERDRKKRLRDIGDAWSVGTESTATVAERRNPWPWVVAVACLGLALVMVSVIHLRETTPEQPSFTLSLNPPEKAIFNQIAISPDGKLLAFTATTDGKRQLWTRPLRSSVAQVLAGTEEAEHPFWSPDNRWIGFFAEGKLKKIEASGGPVQILCSSFMSRGGAWNQDGVILYSEPQGLFRIPAQGGTPRQITTRDRSRLEATHARPVFLPGGRQYLYQITGSDPNAAGVYLGVLDSNERSRLTGNFALAANATSPSGADYLLFGREGALMAQPLDTGKRTLTGESFLVAGPVEIGAGTQGSMSVSPNGILVYISSRAQGRSQLVWIDRGGKRLGTVGDEGYISRPQLSPDGLQVAIYNTDLQRDIWTHDLASGIPTRFTTHPRIDISPVWSPDGSRIAFASTREGTYNLYEKHTSGSGQENLLFKSANIKIPTDWSADAKSLLYYDVDPKTNFDVWLLPMEGDRKPMAIARTEFIERDGAFSPDGKWIAYASDESGALQIYVQPYPGTGSKRQVSKSGGQWPRWRRDGKELYWLELDGTMMAASVSEGQTFKVEAAKPLFETGITYFYERFSVSRDGQRFLVPMPVAETAGPTPATVVWNWLAGAQR